MVLRHARESSKSTSSVRWAGLVFPHCEVVEYRSRAEAPALVNASPGDWLLYPHAPCASGVSTAGVERLWVLDGT